MTEQEMADQVEKVREEIEQANSDRDAILIAFTELARLIIQVHFSDESN